MKIILAIQLLVYIKIVMITLCILTLPVKTSKLPQDIILERELESGEFIFFNDRKVFHTATPVACKIGGYETYRDMVIIDFVKK